MSYYKVLNIDETAKEEEIKKAYRQKVLEYHPDRTSYGIQEAREKFRELDEAYKVLSKDDRRALYDVFHKNKETLEKIPLLNSKMLDLIKKMYINQEYEQKRTQVLDDSLLDKVTSLDLDLLIKLYDKRHSKYPHFEKYKNQAQQLIKEIDRKIEMECQAEKQQHLNRQQVPLQSMQTQSEQKQYQQPQQSNANSKTQISQKHNNYLAQQNTRGQQLAATFGSKQQQGGGGAPPMKLNPTGSIKNQQQSQQQQYFNAHYFNPRNFFQTNRINNLSRFLEPHSQRQTEQLKEIAELVFRKPEVESDPSEAVKQQQQQQQLHSDSIGQQQHAFHFQNSVDQPTAEEESEPFYSRFLRDSQFSQQQQQQQQSQEQQQQQQQQYYNQYQQQFKQNNTNQNNITATTQYNSDHDDGDDSNEDLETELQELLSNPSEYLYNKEMRRRQQAKQIQQQQQTEQNMEKLQQKYRLLMHQFNQSQKQFPFMMAQSQQQQQSKQQRLKDRIYPDPGESDVEEELDEPDESFFENEYQSNNQEESGSNNEYTEAITNLLRQSEQQKILQQFRNPSNNEINGGNDKKQKSFFLPPDISREMQQYMFEKYFAGQKSKAPIPITAGTGTSSPASITPARGTPIDGIGFTGNTSNSYAKIQDLMQQQQSQQYNSSEYEDREKQQQQEQSTNNQSDQQQQNNQRPSPQTRVPTRLTKKQIKRLWELTQQKKVLNLIRKRRPVFRLIRGSDSKRTPISQQQFAEKCAEIREKIDQHWQLFAKFKHNKNSPSILEISNRKYLEYMDRKKQQLAEEANLLQRHLSSSSITNNNNNNNILPPLSSTSSYHRFNTNFTASSPNHQENNNHINKKEEGEDEDYDHLLIDENADDDDDDDEEENLHSRLYFQKLRDEFEAAAAAAAVAPFGNKIENNNNNQLSSSTLLQSQQQEQHASFPQTYFSEALIEFLNSEAKNAAKLSECQQSQLPIFEQNEAQPQKGQQQNTNSNQFFQENKEDADRVRLLIQQQQLQKQQESDLLYLRNAEHLFDQQSIPLKQSPFSSRDNLSALSGFSNHDIPYQRSDSKSNNHNIINISRSMSSNNHQNSSMHAEIQQRLAPRNKQYESDNDESQIDENYMDLEDNVSDNLNSSINENSQDLDEFLKTLQPNLSHATSIIPQHGDSTDSAANLALRSSQQRSPQNLPQQPQSNQHQAQQQPIRFKVEESCLPKVEAIDSLLSDPFKKLLNSEEQEQQQFNENNGFQLHSPLHPLLLQQQQSNQQMNLFDPDYFNDQIFNTTLHNNAIPSSENHLIQQQSELHPSTFPYEF